MKFILDSALYYLIKFLNRIKIITRYSNISSLNCCSNEDVIITYMSLHLYNFAAQNITH